MRADVRLKHEDIRIEWKGAQEHVRVYQQEGEAL
jgi:hypothetical protein